MSGAEGDIIRGAVRLHMLHHAAEGEIHGVWMAEELARHGYQISPGTLYPLLHRMESQGLLMSRRTIVDGRVRRCYTATGQGREELSRQRAALAELAGEVLGWPTRSDDRRAARPPAATQAEHQAGAQ
jgi:DNA-binding PadR family transcriptional regulator